MVFYVPSYYKIINFLNNLEKNNDQSFILVSINGKNTKLYLELKENNIIYHVCSNEPKKHEEINLGKIILDNWNVINLKHYIYDMPSLIIVL